MTRAPHPKAPGLAAGITEPMIRTLVDTFYARVRTDPLLGPIFNRVVENWDEHLDTLCRFWSSVALMTGGYKGTPMKVHAEISDITPVHFERWLTLFGVTAAETCPPDAAAFFMDRANRIAESLQLGIALHRGEGICPHPKPAARASSPT